VQTEPVADWELKKVQMQLRRERAQRLYSSRSRANALGHFAVYYNDPALINTVWNNYERVTRADIQRVARLYLTPARRTLVITLPKTAAAKEKTQ
jgi:predicted Zn-dependent peptidase